MKTRNYISISKGIALLFLLSFTLNNASFGQTLQIKDNGNVGIGTDQPSAKLNVIASSNPDPDSNGVLVQNPSQTSTSNAIIGTRVSGSSSGDPFVSWDIDGIFGWSMGIDNSDSDKLKIAPAWDSLDYNTAMTFATDGKVGIGTSTPGYKLDVEGSINADSIYINGTKIQSGYWDKSGSNLSYSSGNIGIGTGASSHRLTVFGNIFMGGNDTLISNGSINFLADKDKNGNGHFNFFDGATLTANLAENGDLKLKRDLMPMADGTQDVGSSTLSWNQMFVQYDDVVTSDIREKTNIKNLEQGLSEIMAMRPVTYTMKKRPYDGNQIGLIAQELNEIVPDIVFDPAEEMRLDENGKPVPVEVTEESRFGIRYALLTPILIKATQEQQTQIEDLKAQLDEQKAMIQALQATQPGEKAQPSMDLGATELPRLDQNVPNPFDQATKIGFFLPASVHSATLHIYDMQGTPVMEAPIQERGESSYTLDGSRLPAGMFIYALIADGKEIAAKRMVLTK